MSRPFIVLGDALSHGGSVTSASLPSDIGGRPIARVGDACVCSVHGPTTISTGDPTLIIDGQAVARQGDTTACGAALVPSQTVVGVS
ncbi:MAG: PAAR domain-containing protein [Pseudoxanthomonas sp.]